MEMKGASHEVEGMIINNFFAVFKGEDNLKNAVVEPDMKANKEGNAVKLDAQKVAENVAEGFRPGLDAAAKSASSLKVRPRRLPLLGSDNRTSFPVSESVGQETDPKEVPEHWKTGIKTDSDGTKRYKCRYWCECGNKGNHYIPVDTPDVQCHECGIYIDVEPATQDINDEGVPARDDYGNFFVGKSN
ncbi:hypothetical protein RWE15_14395 [Virgibacillus halophilus]|uniref:Uncharacterized protein n=1 Tax=Tigheibacillus halophilus TaxID=361280 RepID=A0ABU5C7T9_9BACI|nr:hypothetical protein [Virgibacillus halophilus]